MDQPPGADGRTGTDSFIPILDPFDPGINSTLPLLPSYSMFCTCSFIFSSSLLHSTTQELMRRSPDLEPIVFTSRFISCSRKSRRRPTGSFELSDCRN